MPADPQSPKVDEWRWTISKIDGYGTFVLDGPDTSPPKDCGLAGEEWLKAARVEVVPASLVDELRRERDRIEDARLAARSLAEVRERERDTARDALREIAEAIQHGETVALDKIAGILANGPLSTR